MAHAVVGEGHQILFRLTKSRFNSLVRQATLLEEWAGQTTYRLLWKPGVKDRQSNPDLPADAALEVLLHQVPLANDTLYLVTTLRVRSDQAGEYYARRYDVEHDIRDVKVTLKLKYGEHSREERGDGEERIADLAGRVQPGGSVPSPSGEAGPCGSASPELHRCLEHLRQFFADTAAMQRAGVDRAIRSGAQGARRTLRLRDVTRSVSEGVRTTNLQFDL